MRPMRWAARRKTLYLLVFFGIIVLVGGAFSYRILSKPASCENGIQDGEEKGIDCEGSCARLCGGSTLAPLVRWSRPTQVTPRIYNAAALVSNQNAGLAKDVPYVFKLFDAEGILVAEKRGSTFLLPRSDAFIFEGGFDVGTRKPIRATFQFDSAPLYERVEGEYPKVFVGSHEFIQGGSPAVSATLTNPAARPVGPVEVVVVLFDGDENAIASSKTLVEKVDKTSTKEIFFTWPQSLSSAPERIDIIPRVIPQ